MNILALISYGIRLIYQKSKAFRSIPQKKIIREEETVFEGMNGLLDYSHLQHKSLQAIFPFPQYKD